MLTRWLHAALCRAHYEWMEEDGLFYGEISVCPGVLATGATLEACREELASTLEDWLLVRVHQHLAIPVIDGETVTVPEAAA